MTNAWITHVKQYATENKVTYSEALKLAKDSYKKPTAHTPQESAIAKKTVAKKTAKKPTAVQPEPSPTPSPTIVKKPRARKSKKIDIPPLPSSTPEDKSNK
jgi:hypothetical protein